MSRDQVESLLTIVLLAGTLSISAVTVLPGRPTPENVTLSPSLTTVTSGMLISKFIPITVKVTGNYISLEPNGSVATKITFSNVHESISES